MQICLPIEVAEASDKLVIAKMYFILDRLFQQRQLFEGRGGYKTGEGF